MFSLFPPTPAPAPTFLSRMMAFNRGPVLDSVEQKKKNIKTFSADLKKEVSTFLEKKADMTPGVRPELPIFFVKSFNMLKKEAEKVGHTDEFLNMVPFWIEMQLLTEFGKPELFPKMTADGLLEDARKTLDDEISQFVADVAFFMATKYTSSRRIDEMPTGYYLTLRAFEERVAEEGTSELEKQLVNRIPRMLQETIERQFPRRVGPDFVEYCTEMHNRMV